MRRHPCTLICLGLQMATQSSAQCTPEWLAVGQTVLSRPGPVAASTLWDPDGPGPLPGQLVLGGDFALAGDPLAPANGIAAWDGAAWSTFAKGPPHSVRTLHTLDGQLLAGGLGVGEFGLGIPLISRWERNAGPTGAWADFPGLFQSPIDLAPSVQILAEFQGTLHAAGHFPIVDGTTVNHIARWNGSVWQPLGTGTSSVFDSVRTLHTHNNDLIVAGSFFNAGGTGSTNIARWNGTTWFAMGSGLNGTSVNALVSHQGALIAAGQLSNPTLNNIAQWNGVQWVGMAGGLGVGGSLSSDGVYALASDTQSLYAAGRFATSGTVPMANIARWDGTTWHALAEGISLANDPFAVPGNSLFSFGGKLGVAGAFTRAGTSDAFGVALWDGAMWSAIPGGCASGQVQALAAYKGDVFAGGTFVRAGGEKASYLARRSSTGGDWQPATPPEAVTNGYVWALLPHDGQLVAAGDFTTIAGTNANRIARWNGSTWSAMAQGMSSTSGLARVQALTVHAGSLIAGGRFSSAGINANNVAQWNGSSWQNLSSGVGSSPNDIVYSLASYKGLLFAGTTIFSNPLRVYNGSSWSSVTTPINGSGVIYALGVSNNELLVAGSFTAFSPSFTQGILRYNGSTWASLGTEPNDGVNGTVRALSVWNESLLVGGYFTQAGGLTASNVALWNGTTWSALGPASLPGASGGVLAVHSPYGEPPIVAGAFASAGEAPAPLTAHFGCACPADCDDDNALTIDDFICFQTLFAVGHPSSDCDGNGNLNIGDFVCFQTQYAVGCG